MVFSRCCAFELLPDALHGCGRKATAKVFATVFLSLFMCGLQAEIYKYVDANGEVVFTDRPEQSAQGAEEIKPVINTGIPAPTIPGSGALSEQEINKAERKLKRNALSRRIDDRIALRKELQAEVDAARKRLKMLQEERESTSTPRPEEIQHSAIRHNSWPKQSYYKRLAEMDEKIEQAKKELSLARKNLRDMKRHPVDETE
jgi:hypothetical protein